MKAAEIRGKDPFFCNRLFSRVLFITSAVFLLALLPAGWAAGATRLYLQNATPSIAPIARGDWGNDSGAVPLRLSTVKYGSIASHPVQETVRTDRYAVMALKLVSDPLVAQTIEAGRLTWILGAQESDSAMNAKYRVHAYVLNSNGSVRGTLLQNSTDTGEWPTSAAGEPSSSARSTTAVTAQAGDRIVIEIGYYIASNDRTDYTGTLWYGGTDSTDLTDGGDETRNPGWFEFSQDIQFVTQVIFPEAGSGTWIVPADVQSIIVECWGGGGGGGADRDSGNGGGGGGGGGAYAKVTGYSVTPGQSIVYSVGAGGAGGTSSSSAQAGGTSSFNGSVCVAAGGAGGGNGTSNGSGAGGAGGATAASIGDTEYAGGSGADGYRSSSSSRYGGGGGGSGGTASAGDSAASKDGATAVKDGGPGGTGGSDSAGSAPLSGPGGGGGGGEYSSGDKNGGAGFDGQIQLSYSFDNIKPRVNSFQYISALIDDIYYTLIFSEYVTGVTSGDFENAGTAQSCIFTPLLDSGTEITLKVSGCQVDATRNTLQPRLKANTVNDAAGNSGPTSSYTVPSPISLTLQSSSASISQEPLFLASRPEPNIILLLDNSLSMTSNRVLNGDTRLAAAKKSANTLVAAVTGKPVRLGLVTFDSDDGGKLNVELKDMQSAGVPSLIETAINNVQGESYTPLAEAMEGIGRYLAMGCSGDCTLALKPTKDSAAAAIFRTPAALFTKTLLNSSSASNPMEYECQQNFVVVLTDGRPNKDRSISPYLNNYLGDCKVQSGAGRNQCDPTPTSDSNCSIPTTPLTTFDFLNGTKKERTYENCGSDYFDDVVAALHDVDLYPSGVNDRWVNNVTTYIIGFGSDLNSEEPLMVSAALNGGDTTYRHADTEEALSQELITSAVSIASVTATASSLATNSTRLIGDVLLYQAKFNSADWSGQLLAYPINSDGSVNYSSTRWDSDTAGKIPAAADRKIFTLKETTPAAGIEFAWASLATSQQTALGSQAILNWLRGDQSGEVKNGGTLRNRTRLLADVVNSDPLVVGAQNFGYDKLPTTAPGQSTYAEFAASQKTRRQILYIGANGGMMHAFDALNGEEKFAYVPRAVFPDLAKLTSTDYTHKYFVDGSFFAGDAYINGAWKTVLIGTLGAGGKSVFALDITDPVNSDGTVKFTQSNVLWEFTDADLGYTFGQPTVVYLATGQWAAVFGNGYGSTNGSAYLYIVDLATGSLIKKIKAGDTAESVANGLSSPALLLNSSQEVQSAYAGDLRGNLWKFDLSKTNTNQWAVDFSGQPFFQTPRSAGGAILQPITAPIEIGKHVNGGYMIYFGTGKYFSPGDNLVLDSTPPQSFYGLRDDGSRITAVDRTTLVAQTILREGALAGTGNDQRVISSNPVDWASKAGWYLDLTLGERVVSSPLLRLGRVIFSTLIPNSSPCIAGGAGWVMEVDAQSGSRLEYSVFDVNKDKAIDETDYVTIGGKAYAVSGNKSTVGIIKTPVVISAGKTEFKYSGGSEGTIEVIREKGTDSEQLGRRSWRILH